MARPQMPRRIDRRLEVLGFRPIGRPAWRQEPLVLGIDGLEALRLADAEGLYQEAAAERMGVSRPTFARILVEARQAVARALTEERALVIGDAPVVEGQGSALPCPVHWGGRRRGRGCRCRHRGGVPGGSAGP